MFIIPLLLKHREGLSIERVVSVGQWLPSVSPLRTRAGWQLDGNALTLRFFHVSGLFSVG